MHELTTFNFENNNIRTLEINNAPWFVGKDIADVLGYQNGSRDINRHVDEEDRQNYRNGTFGNRGVTIINESGLYALIFGSKLESARKFKRWVTSEVLPQIRKTGSYGQPKTDERLELAKIISSASNEALPYIRDLYPDYFKSAPISLFERVSEENTSYKNWLNDYRIDTSYICSIPTLELFNDYVSYCVERRLYHMGKKSFYAMLEFDFALSRKQKSNGFRYFIEQ